MMIFDIYRNAGNSPVVQLVIIAVVLDTVFGCIRAAKDRQFNSCFGINGAIRKIGMVVSILALILVDQIVSFNLIGFLPEAARAYLGDRIGLTEFFGVLYIAYETVSILKNMVLCGLPVKALWKAVKTFLGRYTDELPDEDEIELAELAEKESEDK